LKCGYVLGRDENSARVILGRALKMIRNGEFEKVFKKEILEIKDSKKVETSKDVSTENMEKPEKPKVSKKKSKKDKVETSKKVSEGVSNEIPV
jgi:hypothetical protein